MTACNLPHDGASSAVADAQGKELGALRAELDAIDARLLDVLFERLACCVRIGHHKKVHAVPMTAPHRIGIVQRRAADYAASHAINPTFLHQLYDLIIAETCRLEDEIIASEAGLRAGSRSA